MSSSYFRRAEVVILGELLLDMIYSHFFAIQHVTMQEFGNSLGLSLVKRISVRYRNHCGRSCGTELRRVRATAAR